VVSLVLKVKKKNHLTLNNRGTCRSLASHISPSDTASDLIIIKWFKEAETVTSPEMEITKKNSGSEFSSGWLFYVYFLNVTL
jgi:hypothetical protein